MRECFTRYDLIHLQRLRQQRARMVTICGLFRATYTRDQIVEGLDALRRSYGDADLALERVTRVLAAQQNGFQCINDRVQSNIAGRPQPMFT